MRDFFWEMARRHNKAPIPQKGAGPVLSATFHAEKVDPRSKESVWGTHADVKTGNENIL
jgi:hypothetical protein